QSIFEIELNDFCNIFEYYELTDSANELFAYDAEKEKCLASIFNFTENLSVDFTSSHADLIAAKNEYEQQLNLLLKLELRELDKFDADAINAVNIIFAESLDEDVELNCIKRFLDQSDDPSICNPDNQERIYALLKLNWLYAQDKIDLTLEEKLLEI